MRNLPEAFVITEPITWQFRTARLIDAALLQQIWQVCAQNQKVRSCFLLDARKTDGAEIKLVIAVSFEGEIVDLQQIAAQFQDILSGFPKVAANTAIMSAASFEEQFSGKEFYVRNAN
jgi:hypothetical protein